MAGYRYNKSYDGPLANLTLDLRYLPTDRHVNSDYNEEKSRNLLAKLYLLYRNTDIELLALTSSTDDDKLGATLSKNLYPWLEIHAEAAADQKDNKAYLAGFKYAGFYEESLIVEYFKNSAGLDEAAVAAAPQIPPFGAKSYLAAKLSLKEPFDILRFGPYLKRFENLGDHSRLSAIGGTYDFKNNLTIDLSYNRNGGSDTSEFGKKRVAEFLWFQATWYF